MLQGVWQGAIGPDDGPSGIVSFMSIAGMVISRLEQAVSFINQLFMQAPKMREFFEILDTAPSVADPVRVFPRMVGFHPHYSSGSSFCNGKIRACFYKSCVARFEL